jgi:hypothetical protein
MNGDAANFIMSGGIMAKPDNSDDCFYKLMRKCWKFEPSKRPNFQEIIKNLLSTTSNGDEQFIVSFQRDSFFYQQLGETSKVPFNFVLNFKF